MRSTDSSRSRSTRAKRRASRKRSVSSETTECRSLPASSNVRLAETSAFAPAGVLAGALAVCEIFQRVRGGAPTACRRAVGLDLWDPRRDWLRGESAPPPGRLPAGAWLVGMGNLGQA